MTEEWRAVVGYEGLYEVSDMGRVRSLQRTARLGHSVRPVPARVLRPGQTTCGYQTCRLSDEGTVVPKLIHRVVAEAFIGTCVDGEQVNHKNGVKTDNRIENLEYLSAGDNFWHAIGAGLINVSGADNPAAKLSADDVRSIRKRFHSGARKVDLAREYGLSKSAIGRAIERKTWASVA